MAKVNEKTINGIDMTQPTLTGKEVCKLFGFTRQTMYRRIEDRKLKPLPIPPGVDKRPELKFETSAVLAYYSAEVAKRAASK